MRTERKTGFFFKFKRFKWRDGVIFLGNNSQSKLSGKTKTLKKSTYDWAHLQGL